MSRATAFEAKGDFGRAIADYDLALRLDPNLGRCHYQPRPCLAPQRQSRPRHRRLRSGHPAQSEGRRGLQQPRHRVCRQARVRPRRRRLRAGAQARSEIRARLSQPRPALAGQEGLRPRARRFRPGDPSRARQCGGAQRARRHARCQRRVRPRASPISTRPIALDPNNANYFDNRGNVWRDRGRFDRAVEDYDKAIELSPGFAFAFYNRAQAHYLAGRFSRGAGRCWQGRGAQREFGPGVEPARAYPGEARRAGRRHRRSAAGGGARSESFVRRSMRWRRMGVAR